MRYRNIAKTDLKISSIALGTWVFGGDLWGECEERSCLDTVARALDLGINIIDTAPVYGWGRAETIIGKAVKGKRNKIIISTKCGLIKGGAYAEICLKPSFMRNEIEQSLKRLNTDYIDIYFLHWPDKNTPLEDTLEVVNKLKNEGKIKYIGVSNFGLNLLKHACRLSDISFVQNEYSFLKPIMGNEVFSFCREKGIGFFAYGPLGGGILTGKYKSTPHFKGMDTRKFFYKFYKNENFKQAGKAVAVFEKISKMRCKPVAQAAINWVLNEKAVISVLTGARNPEQIEINAASSEWTLTDEELKMLSELKI